MSYHQHAHLPLVCAHPSASEPALAVTLWLSRWFKTESPERYFSFSCDLSHVKKAYPAKMRRASERGIGNTASLCIIFNSIRSSRIWKQIYK